jgi:carboxymethylenebutenolidase
MIAFFPWRGCRAHCLETKVISGRDTLLVSSHAMPDRRFDAYCVRPDAPQAPAILLLPEMFGLTPAMRESADAFAREGHVVLAPNLFWRAEHPGTMGYEGQEREIATVRLAGLDIDRAIDDIADAARAVRDLARTDSIVAVGHCIGGRLAVLAMSRLRLAGAVSYYGLGLSGYPDEMRTIAAPVQLHYGLADPHVPTAEIDAVAALVADNPHIAIHRYADMGHSFVNPYRPMFDGTQSQIVLRRTLALIDEVAGRKAAVA